MRVLVGPPVAVEQYADPLNEVHVAPLLQHPLPSEHLNWLVVQLPVAAGVRPGGGFVFVKTQFPSASQLVSNGQHSPPSVLAQRYWLVLGQERPQQPVMTDVDLLVIVVSFARVCVGEEVWVKVRVVVTVQRTAEAGQGLLGAQVWPISQHFGSKDVSKKQ